MFKQHIDIFFGLGNQMFQYAFYLAKLHKGCKVVPDISLFKNNTEPAMHNGFELERVFNLNHSVVFHSKYCSQFLIMRAKTHKMNCLFCKDDFNLGYQEDAVKSKKYHMFGFWQSEKYFKDVADIVMAEFVFKEIDQQNAALAQEMQDDSVFTSVSIHVRRGDYISYNFKLLGIGYYKKAVEYIESKVHNPRYFIFSDDMEAAKEIAGRLGINYIPVTLNSGVDSYKDMFLMSQCKHNIIANSSCSWWGAWLNNNANKIVIAPCWAKDFNCEDWITIDE